MAIMLIFVFLIYKVHALLTFKNVNFFMTDWWSPALYLELIDEHQNYVETEKTLLIEISPLSSFYVYPTVRFTKSVYLEFICVLATDHYLKLTCEECEVYITGHAYNMWTRDDFVTTTPNATIAKVNEGISIWYKNTFETPYYSIFLMTQEEFYHSIVFNTSSSGTLYVSFSTPGEKVLMIYFDNNVWTDADGIVLQIEDDNNRKYYSVDFAANYVKII